MKSDITSLIIYEDAHIIVCHKPAGIATQSARIGTPDMVSLLKTHLASGTGEQIQRRQGVASRKQSGSVLRREPYLAVIHRLDQPVEGLLVFAKTPAAARELNRQLTSAGFGKYYRAVVMGVPDPSKGTLEDYMIKDGRANTSRVCTKDTPGAKLARLHYRVEKVCEDVPPVTSVVKIRLDTGRHHQIRVQMAHLGCPLVGDRKYGQPTGSMPENRKTSESLRLCAYRLEFKHPGNGKEMIFELPEK